jgi:hypothetical protein
MAGAPQPFKSNSVKAAGDNGADALFDVTYNADAGSVNWRETVRQIDGTCNIVNIVKQYRIAPHYTHLESERRGARSRSSVPSCPS